MCRFIEFQRGPNAHIQPHYLALQRKREMLVREGEFQLRARQQQPAGFDRASAKTEVGDYSEQRAFQSGSRNLRREPASYPWIQTTVLRTRLASFLQIHALVGF